MVQFGSNAHARKSRRLVQKMYAIVNEEIMDHSLQNKECEGMGTTLVAAICTELFATVVYIGDSRCYVSNDNGFSQLTEDHSLVNELIN